MKPLVAATKTNLLNTKKILSLTEEGYRLLDEKRKILLSELSTAMKNYSALSAELSKTLEKAYASMEQAVVRTGGRQIEDLARAVKISRDILLVENRLMGTNIPVITMENTGDPPFFGPFASPLIVEETIRHFTDAVSLTVQLAEKKTALVRLAREVQKTIRKVNALEKVHIPAYQQLINDISNRLDEESRESFSSLKMIRNRIRT